MLEKWAIFVTLPMQENKYHYCHPSFYWTQHGISCLMHWDHGHFLPILLLSESYYNRFGLGMLFPFSGIQTVQYFFV